MGSWPGWASLLVMSAIFGICALIAYKFTSNQEAIGRVHDDIKLSLLAAKLFRDNLSVTFKSQGKLLWAAIRLFSLSLLPMAVMIVPMILLLVQMAHRYEWQPLQKGQEVLVTAELRPDTPEKLASRILKPPAGVTVTVEACRQYDVDKTSGKEAVNAVTWRIRVEEEGDYNLTVKVNDEEVSKELIASNKRYARVSPTRPSSSFLGQLLWPIEKPLTPGATIRDVNIAYPTGSTAILGFDIHWVITLMVASMVIAIVIKPFFKVQLW